MSRTPFSFYARLFVSMTFWTTDDQYKCYYSALEVGPLSHFMRYINLRLTYYLLTLNANLYLVITSRSASFYKMLVVRGISSVLRFALTLELYFNIGISLAKLYSA